MLLEVKNLYAGYNGADVISGVSFGARAGEILAIAGPNGSGKTTLLKTLAGLLSYRGSVMLEGAELSSFSRAALSRKAALLTQTAGIYFPYSVYDTAALGRYPHSKSPLKILSAEDKEIIERTLVKLELWEIRNRLINELSGGQLQRVFLARTIIQDPDLILLDEPTNHLDLKHQTGLLEYLSLWAKENNKAVAAALHDLNLARRFADSAVLMRGGKLYASGKCGFVFGKKPLEEVYGIDIKTFMLESLEKWRESE